MKEGIKTKNQLVYELTELRSQNAELKKSITGSISSELAAEEASRYAESIIETVRAPLLVLDADLKIISSNRDFYRTFKVTPGETIGCFIYDLGNKQWNIPRLRELLAEVLPEKQAFDDFEVSHNFQNIGHKIMLLNARQIYRKDIGAKMILLAIEDITVRREIENGLEEARKELEATKISEDEAREYAESIINTVREPLIALDQDLRVVTASRSFYNFFKVKPEETVGQLIYDLGNKQWDIPKLRELLETILPQKTTFDNYEVEHDFATIGWHIMLLNARQIHRVLGKEQVILLAIDDITERREIENGLEKVHKELKATKISEDEAREYAESIINTVRIPLIALDHDLKVVTASRSFYVVFKVKPEETVGQLIYDLGNKQWDIPKLRELLETILLQKTTFDNYEVEHNFVTIGWRIMLLNARQIKRVLGKERVILLTIEDITERKHVEEALRESEERYRELSIVDGLTHLYNFRHFYFQLKIELDRSNRYKQPLTLLLLDLDNFKAFNDAYGHVEGDKVLWRLGQVVKKELRQTDSAYRYGGEEFTMLLPMTTSKDGVVTAERIRAEFKKELFSPAPGQDVHVTVSIGLAQYKPQEDIKAFVHRVDQIMYQGKKSGKDMVCSES